MKNWPFRIGFAVVGMIIAVVWWQLYQPEQSVPVQVVAPPPASKPPTKPVTQHPISTEETALEAAKPVIDLEQPLPELKQSDPPMAELLAKLFADQKLDRFFILEHFIERFVVMVDNLPRPQLSKTHRPLKQTPGRFLPEGKRDQLSIAPANYQRYTPLVQMLAALDPKLAIRVFGRDFPVVQTGVLMIATIIIFTNLLVDISYSWLDPRIKYE